MSDDQAITRRKVRGHWTEVCRTLASGEVKVTTCVCADAGASRKACSAAAGNKTPCRCFCHSDKPNQAPGPTGVTRMRVTIDALNPDGVGTKRTAEQATLTQVPVSGWMLAADWYALTTWLRTARPLHKVGLMIGHQERKDDEPWHSDLSSDDFPESPTPESLDAWAAARDNARDAMYAAVLARVDEFVAGFDFTAYGLAAFLAPVPAAPTEG
jgi:hypothetical protein